MTVTVDAVMTSDDGGNSGTGFTDSTKMTIGGSANALLVLASWKNPTIPSGPTASFTWNGVSLTLLTGTTASNASGGTCTTALYALLNPATGNKSLVGSWGSTGYVVSAISFNGVDASSLANAFKNANTATGNSNAPSVTVTSTTNDVTVAIFANDAVSGNFNSVTGTQIFLDNSFGPGAAACYATGTASNTMTAAMSATDQWAASGISVSAPLDILAAQAWM